jgi:hypothetical protein
MEKACIELCAVNIHAYVLTSSYVLLTSTLICLHRVMCRNIQVCMLTSHYVLLTSKLISGVPRNFFRGGFNKFSSEQRTERTGIWGGSPIVRGSGGSCNLVQEISFHLVTFSSFFVLYTLYDDNQFICHC